MNDAVQYHSEIAARWESNYKSEVFSVRERIIGELLAGYNLVGQYWLDAGCGTGTLARFLAARKGCKVLGVDASAEMISSCAATPNTEFRQIPDICETALPDAAFDGVLCSSMLEYVPDPVAALHELRRVLRPNGLLLVSVPNAHPVAHWPVLIMYRLTKHFGRRRWFEYLDHSKHCFSESRFRALLHSCGFRADAVRTWGGVLGPSPILGHGTLLMFRAFKFEEHSAKSLLAWFHSQYLCGGGFAQG
jgi:2-polyprenyl-6-hydroxyphenyl methylase/3-demethylubiquinone-9 3-methyltransferase